MLGGLPLRVGVPGRDLPLTLARRLLAGLVEKVTLADARQEERARLAVREMVRGGLSLLWKAVQLERELRRSTVGKILDNRIALKSLRRWHARCLRTGPGMAAGLLQIRMWRTVEQSVVAMRVAEGSVDAQAAIRLLCWMQSQFAAAHKRIRAEVLEASDEIGVLWFWSWRWYQAVLRRSRLEWCVPAFCVELMQVAAGSPAGL